MRISWHFTLIAFFALIPAYAHCYDSMNDDYMSKDKLKPTPYIREKQEENLPAAENTPAVKPAVSVNESEKSQTFEQIEVKTVCLNGDCRNKWPVFAFKCANYGDRPAGETGDEFCGRMNKTCIAVSIGGGQSFFGECSVPSNSLHSCRCCWVEYKD